MCRSPNPKVAAQGHAALHGHEVPEALSYLWDFAKELHGRSGVGMNGLAPLTYSTIRDWCELKRVRLSSDEVEALVLLDGVLLSPGKPEEAAEENG